MKNTKEVHKNLIHKLNALGFVAEDGGSVSESAPCRLNGESYYTVCKHPKLSGNWANGSFKFRVSDHASTNPNRLAMEVNLSDMDMVNDFFCKMEQVIFPERFEKVVEVVEFEVANVLANDLQPNDKIKQQTGATKRTKQPIFTVIRSIERVRFVCNS